MAAKPQAKSRKRAKAETAVASVEPVASVEAVEAVASAPVAPAPATVTKNARRAKKEKVVRDSFTMPKSDYAKIAELKQRCLEEGISVKKSELLRAGLLLLAAAPSKRLVAAVSAVEAVKTGRPAKA